MSYICGGCGKDVPTECKGCLPPPCVDEDPELFFPISYRRAGEKQVAEAKAVCARCPMGRRLECLDEAVRNEYREGIWGGTTPGEREPLYPKREVVVDRPELDVEVYKMRHWSLERVAGELGVTLAVVRSCRRRLADRKSVSA
jgi:WhiB family redox-sensing transcriptional regulator